MSVFELSDAPSRRYDERECAIPVVRGSSQTRLAKGEGEEPEEGNYISACVRSHISCSPRPSRSNFAIRCF